MRHPLVVGEKENTGGVGEELEMSFPSGFLGEHWAARAVKRAKQVKKIQTKSIVRNDRLYIKDHQLCSKAYFQVP